MWIGGCSLLFQGELEILPTHTHQVSFKERLKEPLGHHREHADNY